MSEKPVEFRIRWDDGDSERQVCAEAHPGTGALVLSAPNAGPVRMDVVTARATLMILSHLVYAVLEPTGPYLAIEARSGDRWLDLRELR